MASLAHHHPYSYSSSLVTRVNMSMNPLSHTNYSRSLAAIALANAGAQEHSLSSVEPPSSASSAKADADAEAEAKPSGEGGGGGGGGGGGSGASASLRQQQQEEEEEAMMLQEMMVSYDTSAALAAPDWASLLLHQDSRMEANVFGPRFTDASVWNAKQVAPMEAPKESSSKHNAADSNKRKSKNEDEEAGSRGSSKRPRRETEKCGSDNSGDVAKPAEPPKPDYIHVRARRGQATDSHSLAERVRREKISERMKYLQDLVPGCSKVTGKAMMLDEIISYVQSLQRQVEFLSMKLASANSRLDFNVDSLLPKQVVARPFPNHQHHHQQLMLGAAAEPIAITSPAYPQLHPQQQALAMQQLAAVTCGLDLTSLATHMEPVNGLRRPLVASAATSSITMPHSPRDPFEDTVSQVSSVWDGELHSVVHMGFAQNRLSQRPSPPLRGLPSGNNMKLER